MSKLGQINLQEFTYPTAQIQEFGGIPQDTSYEYVSSTFLNGLVNYGRNHIAYMLCRYGLLKPKDQWRNDAYPTDLDYQDPTVEAYQAFADAATAKPHFKAEEDDWFVFYETDVSFMFMWYDQDCSDCVVERYSKESCTSVGVNTLEEFVADWIAKFTSGPFSDGYYPRCSGGKDRKEPTKILVRAANKPRGWINS